MDILSAARNYCMFSPGDLVVVAVSGGPDSVAMLHALYAQSSEFEISLHVAHINHGIRGEASDTDEEFVLKLAHQFGLPCTTERVNVPSMRAAMKMGEEEAARELRYKFLQQTCSDLHAHKIAVAHNANDRAESVLLNIIRGSGTAGLRSIRPVRGSIVRPLIAASRREIIAYIEEHSLPFRIDESNLDTSYARNRIRHELIPLLEEAYNPRVLDAMNRLADIALPEDEYLTRATASALRSVRLGNALDAGLVQQLPLAIQRRLIRTEIEHLKGNLLDISLEQTDRILGALSCGTDFTITLPSGTLFAVRRGHRFSIRTLDRFEIPSYERVLSVPGLTDIPESGIAITASKLSDVCPRRLSPDRLLLDTRLISGHLRARPVRPGDRIVPFGMSQPKKLQDVFVDKKIGRRDRARAVVITDDEHILWVPGVIASEATRITHNVPEAIMLVSTPTKQNGASEMA